MKQAFIMRGGPQNDVRLDSQVEERHPETVFAIGFDDGQHQDARVGEQATDDDGTVRGVFEFDPTGSLIEAARRRFGRLQGDDTPPA